MWATVVVGLLMVGDLYMIDRNYVNNDDFVSAREMDAPFQATEADQFILEDTTYYRVYEPQGRLQARTSYFHNSVGGYSAVRPQRMDQLFNYLVDPRVNAVLNTINPETMEIGKPFPVLNLLNIKYMILQAGEGQNVPIINPYANGPAWFVNSVKPVTTADEELKSLEKLDSWNVAVINKKDYPEAVQKTSYPADSTATITLKEHKPNYLKYSTDNDNEGLAVFSEMYYTNGWKSYIDGKEMPHFRANFVLRAMKVPAGKHTIEFKFEPEVVKTGSNIALMSSIGMILLITGGIYMAVRKPQVGKQE